MLSDADREELYARLSAHAAADHIDLAELERRVAAVDAAPDRDAARRVIDDLPAIPGAGDGPAAPLDPGRPRRRHGHGEADAAAVDWRPTAERFRDPRSRKVMRVWEDAAGGRHYVIDE